MACGAIAVKQYAVCPQVAYECMQIVRQLLIIQQCRHQTFALRGGMQNFPRISNRSLQAIGGLLRGGHRRICLLDHAIQFLG